MRYQVYGVEQRMVTVDVEADSMEEALALANEADSRDVEVWDSDFLWSGVTEQF